MRMKGTSRRIASKSEPTHRPRPSLRGSSLRSTPVEAKTSKRPAVPRLYYKTNLGRLYVGLGERALDLPEVRRLRGQVKLILTSPPFPLNRKKRYGNYAGRKYLLWLSTFSESLTEMLHPKGSVVIEIGNAWEPGSPTFSTLPLEALLEFKRAGNLHLCQEFIYVNPAKLPTPAQWVTVDRVRVKDAFTRLWWMSRTPNPDADNSRVLLPYSDDMKRLLATRKYNAGIRPSEHRINATSFLRDNKGAIPPNVLTIANTASSDPYLGYCKSKGFLPHPARMPTDVARFFIKFLTRKGDVVLDPFGGSNVTGAVAEELGRRWVTFEADSGYARGSLGRFLTGHARSLRVLPGRLPSVSGIDSTRV